MSERQSKGVTLEQHLDNARRVEQRITRLEEQVGRGEITTRTLRDLREAYSDHGKVMTEGVVRAVSSLDDR